jgi:prepilin-type N-terminal cleavage/methylation domain-containing protein
VGNEHRRAAGFTLIETLVVVTILGFISVAIAAAFTVIVRTSPANENRADDSRALLNLTRWLPDDIASTYAAPYDVTPTRPNGFTTDGSSPKCQTVAALPSGGESLLNLSWTENSTTYFVDYFWVRNGQAVDGRGQGRIMRYSCFGTLTAGSTSATEEMQMTDRLGELPGGIVPVEVTPVEPPFLNSGSSSIVGGVNFAVKVLDDESNFIRDILQLTAVSKNIQGPDLDVAGGSGSGIAPNQEPPVASDLLLEMHAGTTEIFDLPVYDYDGTLDRLVVTPDNSNVPAWSLTTTLNSLDPQITIQVPLGQPIDTYTIPYEVADRDGGVGSLSATGTITVTIIDPGVEPADPVEVLPPPPPPPCLTEFDDPGAADPNPVKLKKANNNPNNEVNSLNDSVTISITRSGACDPLVIRFVPDPANGFEEFEAFSNSTDLTIAKNKYQWRVGDRPVQLIEVRSAGDVIHDSLTLTVSSSS